MLKNDPQTEASGGTDGRRSQENRSSHDPLRDLDYVLTGDDGRDRRGDRELGHPRLVRATSGGSWVKADSGAHTAVKGTGRFALCWARVKRISPSLSSNRPRVEGGKRSGQAFHAGTNGAPILDNAIAKVECSPSRIVELGDHRIFVAGTEAVVMKPSAGRADCGDSGDEGPRRCGLLQRLDHQA